VETADYTPLDLSSVCNAGADCLQDTEALPTGCQMFHGIPFQIGSPGGEGHYCLIRLAGHDGALSIEAGDSPARHVLFAHRQLATQLLNGGSLGEVVAHYTLHYADGGGTLIPIRERFEIATVPTRWGQMPFLAVADQPDSLLPRYEGPWDAAGFRQAEVK
jgi:hypothetical protein